MSIYNIFKKMKLSNFMKVVGWSCLTLVGVLAALKALGLLDKIF